MNQFFQNVILESTGAISLFEIEIIQSLWSGYGKIIRMGLAGTDAKSVVVKHVRMPNNGNHPRGWNSDLSHERKIKSYQVESAWYQHYGKLCDKTCRIPHCLALQTQGDEFLMVLEDLDEAGFSARRHKVSSSEISACLKWLANFHATFLHVDPEHLWTIGTYWHLDTRPDELLILDDQSLKKAASAIDLKLRQSPFQTLVHGDAKLANFCFSEDGKEVAAVDFQYVGGGCGMKDVAYFLGSCLNENECERREDELLDIYFNELRKSLIHKNNGEDFEALEKNWRELFPIAWTDFHRFLKGWSPGHWKINSYSERLARNVLAML